MASVRWKQMHNTTLMHLFTKNTFRWKKICGTSDKPQQQKNLEKKKQKTSRKPKKTKKTKQTKKTRVSGKGFGGHFSQIPWFFWFFWFLWFFCFLWFFFFVCFFFLFFLVFFSSFFGFFFRFLNFQTISQKRFFDLLPYGLFIADVAQTAPFPQNFAHAAPQHVCHIFSKANSYFISLLLGKSLLE